MKAAAQQTSPAAAMVEQKTIQLPPARQRLKESRLSRLWFQFRILTGLWAAEPWEKVFFGTHPWIKTFVLGLKPFHLFLLLFSSSSGG